MNPEHSTTTDRTTTNRTTTEPTSTPPDDATPPNDAASHTTDATPAIEILVPMYGGGAGPRPDSTSLTTRRR
jgi:hypothetical protein